jgi:hypothetical protein
MGAYLGLFVCGGAEIAAVRNVLFLVGGSLSFAALARCLFYLLYVFSLCKTNKVFEIRK